MRPAVPLSAFTVLLLGLTGCAAADDTYPSLAVRPAERAVDTPPAAPAPLPAPAPETLAAAQAALAQARAAHSRFQTLAASAGRRVAAGRGARYDSDAWAEAQVALAELDAARSQTAAALADLDLLLAEASNTLRDTAPIAAARDTALGLVREEDATLARLSNGVATG